MRRGFFNLTVGSLQLTIKLTVDNLQLTVFFELAVRESHSVFLIFSGLFLMGFWGK